MSNRPDEQNADDFGQSLESYQAFKQKCFDEAELALARWYATTPDEDKRRVWIAGYVSALLDRSASETSPPSRQQKLVLKTRKRRSIGGQVIS